MHKTNKMNTNSEIRLTIHLQPLFIVENLNDIQKENELLEKLLSTLEWFKEKKLLPLPALQFVAKEVVGILETLRDDRKTHNYNSYITKFQKFQN